MGWLGERADRHEACGARGWHLELEGWRGPACHIAAIASFLAGARVTVRRRPARAGGAKDAGSTARGTYSIMSQPAT